MTVSPSSCTQQVLLVDYSQLDTELVAAKATSCLGWVRQEHDWHGMVSRCRLNMFMLQFITQGIRLACIC